MKLASCILLALMLSGCISAQKQTTPEVNRTLMDGLFEDALEDAGVGGAPTTHAALHATSTTTLSEATTTTASSSTSQSTSSTLKPTMECAAVDHPMSQRDCDRGYCNASGAVCRFFPGNLYRLAKCVCMIQK